MHLLVFSHHGGGGKSCVSRLSCVFPGGTFSLVFSQSNLTPPASVRAARNLSASVKRQASRTNFMAPFGDGFRQQGEEVPESADVSSPNVTFLADYVPNSLRDAGVE